VNLQVSPCGSQAGPARGVPSPEAPLSADRQRCAFLRGYVCLGAGWQRRDKRVSALRHGGGRWVGRGSLSALSAGDGGHPSQCYSRQVPQRRCSVLVPCRTRRVTGHCCFLSPRVFAVSTWTSLPGAWWPWWGLWAQANLHWCQPCWGRWRISRDISTSR